VIEAGSGYLQTNDGTLNVGIAMNEEGDEPRQPNEQTRWHARARAAWSAAFCGLLALGGWIAVADPETPLPHVDARPVPTGAAVRVQIDRLDGAWLEGRVITAPLGCTMVRVDDERRAGMGSVPLQSVRELQVAEAPGRWTSLPVEVLRAGDPPGCAIA
jgi:hypothetical protein